MIGKLLVFAKAHALRPKTSIKISVMNQDGAFLFTLNGEMKKAHLPFFSKFMYLWDGPAGLGQYAYFSDLGSKASEHDIDAEPSTGAGLIAGDGNGTICYLEASSAW